MCATIGVRCRGGRTGRVFQCAVRTGARRDRRPLHAYVHRVSRMFGQHGIVVGVGLAEVLANADSYHLVSEVFVASPRMRACP